MSNSKKDISIGSVIESMYKRYKLDSKLVEIQIIKDWENVVGQLIAKHTTSIKLTNKTLYLQFDNGPLKNEMFLQRDLLIKKVNEHFSKVLVEKIFISEQ